jgi:hypothetical protein
VIAKMHKWHKKEGWSQKKILHEWFSCKAKKCL